MTEQSGASFKDSHAHSQCKYEWFPKWGAQSEIKVLIHDTCGTRQKPTENTEGTWVCVRVQISKIQ